MNCPRCNGPLTERTIGPAAVRTCVWCTGTLVRQPQLVGLLTHLAQALGTIDLDAPLPRMGDEGVHLPCPQCGRTMDAFGYMGTNVVTVDRCPDDWLVWADPGELGLMAILHARTTQITDARNAAEKERRDERLRHMALLIDGRRAGRGNIGAALTSDQRRRLTHELGELRRMFELDPD